MIEKLRINTLTFDYPQEPVRMYFSDKDDADKKSIVLKSNVLVPKEVKAMPKVFNLFAGVGGLALYTSFNTYTEGFKAVDIDFHEPENEYFVRRYYNRRLAKYFCSFDNVVVTQSDITKDVEVWTLSNNKKGEVIYKGKKHSLKEMDRFTLRVKYDPINNTPYLLVANDRPALLLNVPLSQLFDIDSEEPLDTNNHITPSMINLVMTRKEIHLTDGTNFV